MPLFEHWPKMSILLEAHYLRQKKREPINNLNVKHVQASDHSHRPHQIWSSHTHTYTNLFKICISQEKQLFYMRKEQHTMRNAPMSTNTWRFAVESECDFKISRSCLLLLLYCHHLAVLFKLMSVVGWRPSSFTTLNINISLHNRLDYAIGSCVILSMFTRRPQRSYKDEQATRTKTRDREQALQRERGLSWGGSFNISFFRCFSPYWAIIFIA